MIDDLRFDFIIGMCDIKTLNISRVGPTIDIRLNGYKLVNNFYQNNLFLIDNIEIPGETCMFVDIKSDQKLPVGDIYVEGRSDLPTKQKDIHIFDVACKSDSPKILIANLGSVSLELPKGFLVGQSQRENTCNVLREVKNVRAESKRHEKFLNERKRNFKVIDSPEVNFGPNLTPDQKRSIQNILNSNYQTFAYSKFDVGLVRGYRYGIDLKDPHADFYVPPRRISPSKLPEVKNQLQNEAKYGLIEPVSSRYNHALVLIRKPDGGLRICSDLRRLNSNMKVERYPIPTIDSILSKLGSKLAGCSENEVFIANFDILQAYRALEVSESDKNKLAFSVEDAMFAHQRMAFGLADAPSTFSFLMRKILNKVPNTFNYLDDVLLVCRGFQEFKDSLDCLLKTLIDYGIILKPSKCSIGLSEIPFLGHLITKTGVRIQPEKVKAIQDLKQPGSKDQLRSQLGMFNFHHCAVPDLYLILAPLFKLLKINVRFQWLKEHQMAFQKAKKAICEANERIHRNNAFPLILSVDSSDTGCGSVLYQLNVDKLEPLAYYSKVFTEPECKLPIRSRELLGISKSVKNWESMLIGEKFTILNDHKSLEWLQSTKVDSLCIRTRNILWYLSHFNFDMCHIKGADKNNAIADCLSRASTFKGVDISGPDEFEPHDDFRDLNMLTENDEVKFAPDVLEILENCFELKNFRESQLNDKYISRDLDRKILIDSHGLVKCQDGRIPIPQNLSHEIVNFLHVKKSHMGINKLSHFLSKYFKIRALDQICVNVIHGCVNCRKVKSWRRLRPEPQPQKDYSQHPMDKVYIDLIDFGQVSANGFRYGLTMMDDLTRFLDCEPLKNKSQKSVSDALIKLFCRWGPPNHVVSDNGKEFIHQTSKMLKEVFGIYHSRISPFNPQANYIERSHLELKKLFQIHHVEIENWDTMLPIILYGYNSNSHAALPDLTPFEALMLRRPRDVLSSFLTNIRTNWLKEFPQLKHFELIVKKAVKRHEQLNFDSQKYTRFKKGEKCLVYMPLPKNACAKLYNPWHGPFVVMKCANQGVYQIKCPETNRRFLRNVRHMRKLDKNVVNEAIIDHKLSNDHVETQMAPPVEDQVQPPVSKAVAPSPSAVDSNSTNHSNLQVTSRPKRQRNLPKRYRD